MKKLFDLKIKEISSIEESESDNISSFVAVIRSYSSQFVEVQTGPRVLKLLNKDNILENLNSGEFGRIYAFINNNLDGYDGDFVAFTPMTLTQVKNLNQLKSLEVKLLA